MGVPKPRRKAPARLLCPGSGDLAQNQESTKPAVECPYCHKAVGQSLGAMSKKLRLDSHYEDGTVTQAPLANPKPRPRALEKQDRKDELDQVDERESDKVKLRSGGRCEVFVVGEGRCIKRGMSVHHMIGGIGVRGRGKSALAEHKQHVCDGPSGHHEEITRKILRLLKDGELPLYTDAYERVD